MAELDEILKRYTDPATGSVHGATFVAVDSKGVCASGAALGSNPIALGLALGLDRHCPVD
jgi:hypothetical protein